jgi:hypothetical protein
MMFYQSCGSVGDSYEEHTSELMTDDETDSETYQYYHLEDYYYDGQVERAIAQSEYYEMNVSLAQKTGQVESGLWAGAERVVL